MARFGGYKDSGLYAPKVYSGIDNYCFYTSFSTEPNPVTTISETIVLPSDFSYAELYYIFCTVEKGSGDGSGAWYPFNSNFSIKLTESGKLTQSVSHSNWRHYEYPLNNTGGAYVSPISNMDSFNEEGFIVVKPGSSLQVSGTSMSVYGGLQRYGKIEVSLSVRKIK